MLERLDKILSNARIGSRKEVTALIKAGRITVNATVVTKPAAKFHPDQATFYFDGLPVDPRKFIYLMLNKPAGYLSATEDAYDPIVTDLISSQHRAFDPFPVGRLDKDTTGLLLLTNDGELNHKLISPRWKVDKVYVAELRDPSEKKYRDKFRKGIVLDDGYRTLPGEIRILSEDQRVVEVTIQEGKFHQVKRMFEALGNKVTRLERIQFGPLSLPDDLEVGDYRELKQTEEQALFQEVAKSPKLQQNLAK